MRKADLSYGWFIGLNLVDLLLLSPLARTTQNSFHYMIMSKNFFHHYSYSNEQIRSAIHETGYVKNNQFCYRPLERFYEHFPQVSEATRSTWHYPYHAVVERGYQVSYEFPSARATPPAECSANWDKCVPMGRSGPCLHSNTPSSKILLMLSDSCYWIHKQQWCCSGCWVSCLIIPQLWPCLAYLSRGPFIQTSFPVLK